MHDDDDHIDGEPLTLLLDPPPRSCLVGLLPYPPPPDDGDSLTLNKHER